ncbi:hypothetical protein CGGC5_v007019 [Colletotrichum fructicola Nara gc5]|uniref:Ankyrin repeat protein n=1 Tax=Colletotrichum fructicola (strain Nara gc5) TaxID=1213859 RepID=A0A7J6J6A6_COLFN|nr:hypothetical protein CFRS1_v011469 [Colletotrichum fructicola]KAF4485362.1 hypothetical protein CGGC5_v007019 [Colletotrichum fructicola Nara gc5]
MSIGGSIHERVSRNEEITRGDLRKARSDPSFQIDDAPDGYSALAWAVMLGNLTNISLLKSSKANTRARYKDQSLLHMAVTAKENAFEVVKLILKDESVDRNAREGRRPNDTPLMTALRNQADPRIIDALKKAGASETVKNSNGETAKDIANGLISPSIGAPLEDPENQGSIGPTLAKFIISAVLLLFAYCKPWKTLKDALAAAFKQINNEIGKANAGDKPQKPQLPSSYQDCVDSIKKIIKDMGLDDSYPPDHPLIDDIADEAWERQKDAGTKTEDPGEFNEKLRSALYQPIIYCDDSGSMEGNRWTAQTDLVEDIGVLMNSFAPENMGVHIRFLNRNDGGLDNVRGSDIRGKFNFKPNGSTKLGTGLNEKILKPFVYNILDKEEDFKRPPLIITITDGEPNEEDQNTFANGISTCSQKCSAAYYSPDFVRFLVNQVGDDAKAALFLDGLQNISKEKKYKDLLHVTSDKLDQKYYELRKNKRELNLWLFETILPPRP